MLGLLIIMFIILGIICIVIGLKDWTFDSLIGIGIALILLSWLPSLLIYLTTTNVDINNQAHNYCIKQGYDTFESWEGYGFFPDDYLYIKCKFVDNRQDIQGNLKFE